MLFVVDAQYAFSFLAPSSCDFCSPTDVLNLVVGQPSDFLDGTKGAKTRRIASRLGSSEAEQQHCLLSLT